MSRQEEAEIKVITIVAIVAIVALVVLGFVYLTNFGITGLSFATSDRAKTGSTGGGFGGGAGGAGGSGGGGVGGGGDDGKIGTPWKPPPIYPPEEEELPDLVVSKITFNPKIPIAGKGALVTVIIGNIGDDVANSYCAKLVIESANYAEESCNFPPLAPGASQEWTTRVTFATAVGGNAIASADNRNYVLEEREDNNSKTVVIGQ